MNDLTDKLFERIRRLEVRMAFYAGAAAAIAAVLTAALDRAWGKW